MTDSHIILTITVPVFLLLLGIIGFFLKGIYLKLDLMQTKETCKIHVDGCEKLMAKDDKHMIEKIDNLTDSLDSLCLCLKDYTKGVCP